MIQRIQSVFLFMVAIVMIAMLFFQTFEKTGEDGRSVILSPIVRIDTVDHADYTHFPYTIVGILAILGAGVALFEIFQYKNRLRQIKLGALNALIISAVLVLTIVFILRIQEEFDPENLGTYKLGIYFPAAALILNVLANRFIRRDERLVRSVDRLR